MTSRVSSKNKGKIVLKKETKQEKKTVQLKETENSVAGSRTRFICTRPDDLYLMTLAIPQHGPQNKLTKLYNHGHKISKRFTQAD